MIFEKGFKDLKHEEKVRRLLDYGEVGVADLLKEIDVQEDECKAIGAGDERAPGMAKITRIEESYKT